MTGRKASALTLQSKSVPMAPHDGPPVEDLRARQMSDRINASNAVIGVLAGLAYAVPEKMERRA